MYFNLLNKLYYFCDHFNINEINGIKKISIIFNLQHKNSVNTFKIEKMIKYCKKFSIPYYFINNIICFLLFFNLYFYFFILV